MQLNRNVHKEGKANKTLVTLIRVGQLIRMMGNKTTK